MLIPLNVFLYGDLAARHNYERQRNLNFTSVSCKQRPRTSVFKYVEKQIILHSGRAAGSSLVASVDDHMLCGRNGHIGSGWNNLPPFPSEGTRRGP